MYNLISPQSQSFVDAPDLKYVNSSDNVNPQPDRLTTSNTDVPLTMESFPTISTEIKNNAPLPTQQSKSRINSFQKDYPSSMNWDFLQIKSALKYLPLCEPEGLTTSNADVPLTMEYLPIFSTEIKNNATLPSQQSKSRINSPLKDYPPSLTTYQTQQDYPSNPPSPNYDFSLTKSVLKYIITLMRRSKYNLRSSESST